MLTKEQIGEIRAAYRDAKDPQKQIGILADLYVCTETEIRQVLGIEETMPDLPPAAKKPAAKRAVKSYDQAVRDQLTKAVILGGESIAAVCERMGVPQGTAAKWVAEARKKQAEFLGYDSKVQNTPKPAESVTQHRTQSLDPNNILKELKAGVEGLQSFVDSFAGVDLFTRDQWDTLDLILAKAEGFAAGMDTAIQLEVSKQ